MENGSDKMEPIKAIQSAISKSEKALAQMAGKGANTTLLKKRLVALRVGLAVLENSGQPKPYQYSQEDLAEARYVLAGLFPSMEEIYARTKAGSPQKTLLKRRMEALAQAVHGIDDLSWA